MTTTDSGAENWWRHGVVYQVYVRSFADGNGDGTGDIAGLRSKLGYLSELGVDALWINPWYSSPLKDGGYDVADYRAIDERFGTTEEVEIFIEEAHTHGIKVIADLVPNHTSDQHRWFQEALDAAPGDPARDRYIFQRGKGADGSGPPSNWAAVFGGSAWEQVADGEWYLHLFDPSQPDLNWENEEVRTEFDSIFRFWLDRGIDGFRIDVAHGLVKDLTFPDVAEKAAILESERIADHPHWDRDGVHEINRRWRAVLDEYEDRMMVAEAWVAADRLPLYLRPDEYHQSFNFDLLDTDWDAQSFAEVIEKSVRAAEDVGAASTWVLSNHDVMRHATRYGLPNGTKWRQWPMTGPHEALDESAGFRRARAAALITLSLPGSTYIYQGEELGLPEVWDLPLDVLDDPTWERSGHTEKGRDGCRIPIPWEEDGPSFGFGMTDPWIPQPARFGSMSVAVQTEDTSSSLSLYRTAIALRRQHLAVISDFQLIDMGSDVLAYERGDVLVVVNMGSESVPMPEGDILLASQVNPPGQLAADSAVWIRQ
jgi:alpha-glucosidase